MSDRVNLMETLGQIGMFSAFTRMMRTSAAAELLDGAGPFTVFAPTNDAFGKIPDDEVSDMINEKDQVRLKALLSYHIVPGKLFAANLPGRSPMMSVSGSAITVTDQHGLKINGSGVLSRNIEATNGVIHGLDTVLTQPPAVPREAAAATIGEAPAAKAAAPYKLS
jgi:uncharacterized surface protein with fasciclin (FAS1) repeats